MIENTNKSDIVSFLFDLREKCLNANTVRRDEKIFIVWDNHSAHCSVLVLSVCKELNFEPIFMPTYAPYLNSIEILWAHVKRRISTQIAEKIGGKDDLSPEEYFTILTAAMQFEESLIKQILLANRKSVCETLDEL